MRVMIRTKRVYSIPCEDNGLRILVDRIWPRGLTKERAKVNLWLQDVAPSHELRKWFAHSPDRWVKFKQQYFEELQSKKGLVNAIIRLEKAGDVTLLYGAKEEQFNNAVALKEYIQSKMKRAKV
jgi:uncharacterized protein YeaO (DUF488 family)